jgi:hypothetical protein
VVAYNAVQQLDFEIFRSIESFINISSGHSLSNYRERGLETFEFLCRHSFRPGGSHQQLSVQRMSVYIGRFYSEGSLYINLFLTEEFTILVVTQLSNFFALI